MAYRTILVQVDGSQEGQARASRALSLAARFDASVTAVFLKSDRIPPFMTGDGFAITPGEIIQQFVDERAQETARLSVMTVMTMMSSASLRTSRGESTLL
jgi:nucleotide-binding universal stress UspA family protein